METDLAQRLASLEEKLDKIYKSAETTRKYIKWTAIISIVLFVLPIVGLVFAIPAFLNGYVGDLQNITNLQ